jgi:ubiquinol-cytochrome c reductase cytochrome b subunit
VIRNPRSKRFFGGSKSHATMDPYPPEKLPEEQLKAVVEYVTSLMGPAGGTTDATLVATGKKLFEDELDCSTCHKTTAGEASDGPNFTGHGSEAWLARVIKNSSEPDIYGSSGAMPKFQGKLTDEQIADLAKFVHSQREGDTTKPGG